MTLYINIGAPGSGKSTLAEQICRSQRIKEGEIIIRLCADELRGLYSKTGDEGDQSVSYQAFQCIAATTEIAFRQGFSVLIDVTSKNKKARSQFLDIARKYGVYTVALVFNTPLEVCLARNAARKRVVPPEVVVSIYNEIQAPLPGEFDEIRVIPFDS